MPRYYDIDKLAEMVQAKADTLIEGKEAFLYVAKWLELLPAADVVPKSEVEKLIIDRNAARLGMIAEGHNDPRGEDGAEGEDGQGDLNPLYCMKKAEVAREIFEEIDQIFRKQYELCSKTEFKLLEPILQGERFTINEMWHKVAELKKKYTEVATDESAG